MKTRIDLFRLQFNHPIRRRWVGKCHGIRLENEQNEIVMSLCGRRWWIYGGDFWRHRPRTGIECKSCLRSK